MPGMPIDRVPIVLYSGIITNMGEEVVIVTGKEFLALDKGY